MSGAAKILLGLTPVFGPSMIGAASILDGAVAYRENKKQAGIYAGYERNARQQARNQASQEREKYRKLASSRRAAMGASGLDVNMGSPADLLADTRAEGEVSAMRIFYGGELDAANWRERGVSAKQSGNNAFAQGILGGAVAGIAAKTGTSSRYRGLWGLD